MDSEQWGKMDDVERWKWLAGNQSEETVVMLDNDMTCVKFGAGQDEEWFDFDGYIGWNEGAISLLTAIGIQCECA